MTFRKAMVPSRLIGKLIDFDANLMHPDLASFRDDLVFRASDRNVGMFVVPGSTKMDSLLSIELSKVRPDLFFSTFGVHPYNATQQLTDSVRKEVISMVQQNIDWCSCIGECGLDYSDGFPDKQLQIPWFKFQLELALIFEKPLYLHVRKAHADFLDCLETEYLHKTRIHPLGAIHCFTGTYEELCVYVEMGWFIGLTGYIINANQLPPDNPNHLTREEIARWLVKISLERLVIETDAPYMGFKGCRLYEGKDKKNKTQKYPNAPSALMTVAEFIHDLTQWPLADIVASTTANAWSLLHRPIDIRSNT